MLKDLEQMMESPFDENETMVLEQTLGLLRGFAVRLVRTDWNEYE